MGNNEGIKKAVKKVIAMKGFSAGVTVYETFIEITIKTKKEAEELKAAFKLSFSGVEIFDLSEIDEVGFMLDIRF